MLLTHALRRALPVGALALAIHAAPALAFQPSVLVFEGASGDTLSVQDISWSGSDGDDVVATLDQGPTRSVVLSRSTDAGATWSANILTDPYGLTEPQAAVCAGHAVTIYRRAFDQPATQWSIDTFAMNLESASSYFASLTSVGVFRKPDVACIANQGLVSAMFVKSDGIWRVRVMTSDPAGISGSSQSFNLGKGTVSRGLAIASSATRVYVAWFDGSKLKLRRFSIGSTASHSLTSLGTSTIATLPDGMYPEIGADGDRVILAYMDRADLKVRRSSDRGRSWGSARTLRDEPFPSEIGAYPTTVAVKGSRVAIGAVEIGGVEMGVGKGLGYKSTNGGSSYTRVSTRSSGRIVAGLLKVGSVYKYAEAFDTSISQPNPRSVRFRRQ